MTPETIEEIRLWAKGGNEPRDLRALPNMPGVLSWTDGTSTHYGNGRILNQAGLAIAAQAERVLELERENELLTGNVAVLLNDQDSCECTELRAALEQARDTAESLTPGRGFWVDRATYGKVETMRANCERLLK